MLVLEIAFGTILAYMTIEAIPLIVSAALDAVARAVLILSSQPSLPPFWRNAADKRRGPNPAWLTALIVGTGAVTCGLLSVLAFLSAYLGV